MEKLQKGLTGAVLAAALAATGITPANAAPSVLPKAAFANAQSDVVQVRDGRWHNGYRGYPRYRAGYRYHDGWWYPAGAFIAGALIGGAIAGSNYYGGYYGGNYYNGYYADGYYAPRRYYPTGSSYREGYRDGYRDGYYARRYNDITCTPRLQDAGKC